MPCVVVAPDKFKGSCSAGEAATAIEAGLRAAWGTAFTGRIVPMADGGEGTVAAFLEAGATPRRVRVHDALGRPVAATYAMRDGAAIAEMSAASGLAMLGGATAPRTASTYGTGELIVDALAQGAKHIVLGIGGSATTDGGAGALAALGARFYDAAGTELVPSPVGLAALAAIDISGFDSRLALTSIEIACDVDNPLTGPSGAAAVYGPQKGASAGDVAFLDGVLTHFADVAAATVGRDLRDVPGAGAAGGLGWALATFCNARLVRGVDVIARLVDLPGALRGAALCVTGEGHVDAQSLRGKVVDGVARYAAEARVPVLAIGGSVDADAAAALAERGVTCVALIGDPSERERAMREAPALIRAAAERWARSRPAPA